MTTHYETLGLPREASAERVKRSYRSLVKIYHPDKFSSGSAEQAEAEKRDCVGAQVAHRRPLNRVPVACWFPASSTVLWLRSPIKRCLLTEFCVVLRPVGWFGKHRIGFIDVSYSHVARLGCRACTMFRESAASAQEAPCLSTPICLFEGGWDCGPPHSRGSSSLVLF